MSFRAEIFPHRFSSSSLQSCSCSTSSTRSIHKRRTFRTKLLQRQVALMLHHSPLLEISDLRNLVSLSYHAAPSTIMHIPNSQRKPSQTLSIPARKPVSPSRPLLRCRQCRFDPSIGRKSRDLPSIARVLFGQARCSRHLARVEDVTGRFWVWRCRRDPFSNRSKELGFVGDCE